MERKLASIQKILSLTPIKGADRIEVATILGWQCIVKKGEFKEGDFCVFFEVDSILPPEPQYIFLEKSKYRIKTIRMKGQVSQGLAVPFSIAFKGKPPFLKYEGSDFTEKLGVIKYEPGEPAGPSSPKRKLNWFQKIVKKWMWMIGLNKEEPSLAWPSFLQKTDEERIQSCPSILHSHVGELFYKTEKLDGSSCTLYWNKGRFGACSKNRELRRKKITGSSGSIDGKIWLMVQKYNLEGKLKLLKRNIGIQGELIGPGIQKNKYKLNDYQYRLFRLFDIDTKKFIDFDEAKIIARYLDLEWCPILEEFVLEHTIQELVECSKGKSQVNPKATREGIVVRSVKGSTSFKVINPDFLLEHDE